MASTMQTSPGGSKVSSNTNWFTSEIQQMMHGFGDCRRPLHDTAVLVEEIVHTQLASMLMQASDIAATRSSRFIAMEDFLFLLRKDKIKLRRLLKYMEVKDMKATQGNVTFDEEEPTDMAVQPTKKRKKICQDFLASIDTSGELTALFEEDSVDDVKYDRLLRAEAQTRNMTSQQYTEYTQARQASFGRKYKSQRFKDWVLAGVTIDIKPNLQAWEVISYLAYETVAQIVDLALIVKQDMRAITSDPVLKNQPNMCLNYYDAVPMATILGSNKGSLGGMGSPSRPSSPPSTPTTPSVPGATPTPALSLSQGSSGSSSSSKSKSKKRKKSGPANLMEMMSAQAIQPTDVREALRRYGQSFGFLASQTKVNTCFPPKMRLFCA